MYIVPRCKCLLIGESNTGKSSIVQRFLDPNAIFNKKYNMTTGVNISFKQVKINNKVNTTNQLNALNNLSNLQANKTMNTMVSFDNEDDDEENQFDNLIGLYLYDTSGKQIYLDLLKNICNNVSMIIGVFDVCKIDSFKKLQNILNDLMKQFNTSNNAKNNLITDNSNKSIVLGVILGNKIDLQERRVVDKQEAIQLAKKYKFQYFECSMMSKSFGI